MYSEAVGTRKRDLVAGRGSNCRYSTRFAFKFNGLRWCRGRTRILNAPRNRLFPACADLHAKSRLAVGKKG